MPATIERQIAETVAEDLRAAITDSRLRVRIWQGDKADHARVYTGFGDEHLRIYRDGRVECSRSRMTWGHVIDDVLASDAMERLPRNAD